MLNAGLEETVHALGKVDGARNGPSLGEEEPPALGVRHRPNPLGEHHRLDVVHGRCVFGSAASLHALAAGCQPAQRRVDARSGPPELVNATSLVGREIADDYSPPIVASFARRETGFGLRMARLTGWTFRSA